MQNIVSWNKNYVNYNVKMNKWRLNYNFLSIVTYFIICCTRHEFFLYIIEIIFKIFILIQSCL